MNSMRFKGARMSMNPMIHTQENHPLIPNGFPNPFRTFQENNLPTKFSHFSTKNVPGEMFKTSNETKEIKVEFDESCEIEELEEEEIEEKGEEIAEIEVKQETE